MPLVLVFSKIWFKIFHGFCIRILGYLFVSSRSSLFVLNVNTIYVSCQLETLNLVLGPGTVLGLNWECIWSGSWECILSGSGMRILGMHLIRIRDRSLVRHLIRIRDADHLRILPWNFRSKVKLAQLLRVSYRYILYCKCKGVKNLTIAFFCRKGCLFSHSTVTVKGQKGEDNWIRIGPE